MKKTLPFFILLLAAQICKAQFTNLNWKVGRHTAIDFKTGTPYFNIADSNKSLMTYTNTSICDRNGDIVFYSNACKVYDRNGHVMPNGSGFNQGTVSNTYVNTDYYPSFKAATIVPFPNDSNKFYMFYLNMEYTVDGDYIPAKLYYLVVDRTLNGGLGDVVVKDQIAISGDTLNKSTVFAIKHGNGKDWWIIVRKHKGNKYFKVLIDSSGVHSAATQIIGNAFNYPYSVQAVANMNLQGNKMCYIHETNNIQYFQMDLFDFDRCNGMLSVNQTIFHPNITDTITWTSCCFSPNGKFLYVTDAFKIYQLDVTATNLLNSKQTIGINTILYADFFRMEIAPNNKIYVAPYGGYIYMSVINKPDSFGLTCDFVENGIQFGANQTTGPWADGGLPNTPNFALGKIDCGVGIEEQSANTKNELLIYPNPASQSLVISCKSVVNTIEVTNLLGQVCIIPPCKGGKGDLSIDISTLSNGIYFIKATDEKGNVMNGKFVKE